MEKQAVKILHGAAPGIASDLARVKPHVIRGLYVTRDQMKHQADS
jgi:hypothetical protein